MTKKPQRTKSRKSSKPAACVRDLPETGLVRQSQLIPGVLPFSHTTLWRMVKRHAFPAPVKLSPRMSAWRVEEVRAYLADPAGYCKAHERAAAQAETPEQEAGNVVSIHGDVA